MYSEKIAIIKKRLQEQYIVFFRLYNALYRISISNNLFFIRQEGMEIVYSYDSLKSLFCNYVVYGFSLIDLLDDIKLC